MAQNLKAAARQAEALTRIYSRQREAQGLGVINYDLNDAIRQEREQGIGTKKNRGKHKRPPKRRSGR